MSFHCHTKANGVAKQNPRGVNSVPTQCNLGSILFQSKPIRPPITHNFSTNPLTILYLSIANPMLIKCQSITNLIPILFQSIGNSMSIQSHSGTNALPFLCQSSHIAVQIHCQFITNIVLLIHYNPISIQCQYGANRASKWHYHKGVGANRGGRLALFDSLCARCFAFLRTSPKNIYVDVF